MTDQSQTFAPPPGQPGGGAAPTLYRSRSDRKLAGVCGGVAAYLGIDPVILRIVIVVLSLFGGSGLLVYAAGWLLLPDEGQQRSEVQKLLDRDGSPHSASAVVVAGLVIIGVLIGFGSLVDRHWWLGGGPDVWPLLVIAGIGGLIWYSRRQSGPTPPSDPPASAGAAQPPYTAPAGYAPQPPSYPAYAYPTAEHPTASYPTASYPTASYPTAAYATGPAGARKPPRQRSVLGPLTLSVAAIAAGIMLPFSLSGRWHVTAAGFLAVLLGIVGLGLVVGAFVGRSRGLIAWGIVLALATGVAGAIPSIDLRGTGDVSWRPVSARAMPVHGYRWAAGDATLDLTALPAQGQTIRVTGQLGAGDLVVLVPANVRLVVAAHVGLGDITLPGGIENDGVGRRSNLTLEPSAPPGAGAAGTLELSLEVGAGNVEVRRAQA